MKTIRKICISKEERKVLDRFFEMCEGDLELGDEDIGDLVRTIYMDCTDFEVKNDLYDIEYTN